jgi:hypothetical protein
MVHYNTGESVWRLLFVDWSVGLTWCWVVDEVERLIAVLEKVLGERK